MSNAHYTFYTEYYQALAQTDADITYQRHNRNLISQQYQRSDHPIPLTEQSFVLETCYPGLLIGLGYSHAIDVESPRTAPERENQGAKKTSSNAIKLGISMDYTSGLPVLPGSMVKGILRNAFRQWKPYIQENCTDEDIDIHALSDEKAVSALETAIFGEWCKDSEDLKKSAQQNETHDVFFDAIPVRPDPAGRLLNLESITPHIKPEDGIYSGMKEPIPLKMLKIRPEVQMLFRFRLKDTLLPDTGIMITSQQKLQLFKRIIVDLGVGAKTNVGYGVMEAVPNREIYFELIPGKPISGTAISNTHEPNSVQKPKSNVGAPSAPTGMQLAMERALKNQNHSAH